MIEFTIDLSEISGIIGIGINREMEATTKRITPRLFHQAPTCKGGKPGAGLAKIEQALDAITENPEFRLSIEQKIEKNLEVKLREELEKLASPTH